MTKRKKKSPLRSSRYTLFGILLILLSSHRFVNIAWTDDFQNDEGFYALVASTIMQGGRIYDDFAFGHPPFMPYIGATYMSVAGVSLVNLRFLAILSSTLTVLCLYFIVRNTLKDEKKIYVASFLSVLPLAVLTIINSHSRVYYIEPFVTFVSCAAVYAASKKTKNGFLISGFLAASGMLMKLWAIPTAAALFAYVFWTDRKNLRYLILGFFAVMLPFFLHLALSEKALEYILFQASRDHWTIMQKTKPLWDFYRALPYLSIASIPLLYAKKHRLVFLWTLSTFIFFYTIMPDAISHHTYFMAPVFTLSSALLASESSPKKLFFWLVLALILYSIAEERHIQDIQFKMKARGTKLTQVAQYVEANTDPSDTILSDYAMITFISKRRQAGYLLDTSETAIYYDLLTSKDLIAVSEAEKPVYIIVESRFKNPNLASFMAYVNATYAQEIPPGFDSRPFEVYRRIKR
jgi:4-amino-4-deoxy-L-arabinose transferase-like glycosyltransferase